MTNRLLLLAALVMGGCEMEPAFNTATDDYWNCDEQWAFQRRQCSYEPSEMVGSCLDESDHLRAMCYIEAPGDPVRADS